MVVRNFQDSKEGIRALTLQLINYLDNKSSATYFNLALSGGETAKQMFLLWVKEFSSKINWNNIRFFWVDERCVPPTDSDSNYGHADKLLFKPLNIRLENIYRIRGEAQPSEEVIRYSRIVKEYLPHRGQLPFFDCIILGIGNDGHTASIFRDQLPLLTNPSIYAVSQQPVTSQYRITMTGPVILNGSPLLIPVFGLDKAGIIEDIKKGYSGNNKTPAAYILSMAKEAYVYTS